MGGKSNIKKTCLASELTWTHLNLCSGLLPCNCLLPAIAVALDQRICLLTNCSAHGDTQSGADWSKEIAYIALLWP